jgi:3-dehydroquinate synthase
VGDVAGFLAAVFMRGIPVIQAPTTLVAQVDAAVGGKTGVNLSSGKNLIGSFHQPRAVVIDPEVLSTLPEREYRAGLFEVVKHGIIRCEELFALMAGRAADVLRRQWDVVDRMVDESVRIKAEVVSADEREGGLRRILNFGHTFGHALEAETGYTRFLHGEAVGWGMRAATRLGVLTGHLAEGDADRIGSALALYGPIPSLAGIAPAALLRRLASDKKTIKGAVHFVVPDGIGRVRVVSGVDDSLVRKAIESTLS